MTCTAGRRGGRVDGCRRRCTAPIGLAIVVVMASAVASLRRAQTDGPDAPPLCRAIGRYETAAFAAVPIEPPPTADDRNDRYREYEHAYQELVRVWQAHPLDGDGATYVTTIHRARAEGDVWTGDMRRHRPPVARLCAATGAPLRPAPTLEPPETVAVGHVAGAPVEVRVGRARRDELVLVTVTTDRTDRDGPVITVGFDGHVGGVIRSHDSCVPGDAAPIKVTHEKLWRFRQAGRHTVTVRAETFGCSRDATDIAIPIIVR